MNTPSMHCSIHDFFRFLILVTFLSSRKSNKMDLNSYEYYTTSDESDREDNFIECAHCRCKLLATNYTRHLSTVHGRTTEVKCEFCNNYMKSESLQAHIERKHTNSNVKCQYCSNSMPEKSLPGHIERCHTQKVKCRHCNAQVLADLLKKHESDHYEKCKHCGGTFLKQNLKNHITLSHPLHATIGMIKLDRISDERFNELVEGNCIYAKDGHVFIK